MQGPEIDYYFSYGPTPKEIFEEQNLHANRPEPWSVASERFGSWATLKASLLRMVQGAMSGAISPMFNLAAYNTAPPELQGRARQLGSLVARVSPGTVGLSGFRKQLDTFFGSYVAELQDRGFPIWHPLPLQVPDDREGAFHADEFLLGDEMLVAPLYEPGDRRSVYLPRGNWTNLETNELTQGPRTITVETKSLPVFARNGAIVPLDAAGGMALHYFPKAGGEFFLLEGDIAEYSQVHASPALDFMRLEIESKKDRDYQWVVHHVDKPSSVGFEDARYGEAADARRTERPHLVLRCGAEERPRPREGEGGRGLHRQSELRLGASDGEDFGHRETALAGFDREVFGKIAVTAGNAVPDQERGDRLVECLAQGHGLVEDGAIGGRIGLVVGAAFEDHEIARRFDRIEDVVVEQAPVAGPVDDGGFAETGTFKRQDHAAAKAELVRFRQGDQIGPAGGGGYQRGGAFFLENRPGAAAHGLDIAQGKPGIFRIGGIDSPARKGYDH